MVWIVIVLLALGLGYRYTTYGLFNGSVMMICVCLAVLAGVAFGPGIADAMELVEDWQYGAMIGGVGLLAFAVIRGALGPLDVDVDFHKVVERIGGGLTGAATGLLLGGFLAVCVACANIQRFESAQVDLKQASALVLTPARTIGSMFPGPHELLLQTLVDRQPPPEPEPEPLSPEGMDADADDSAHSAPGAPDTEPAPLPGEANDNGSSDDGESGDDD